MRRVVIDTNVLVSGMIQNSYPRLIIDTIFLERDIAWCVSNEVLYEYDEVLSRVKFHKYPGFIVKAERLLAFADKIAIRFPRE